MSPMGFNLGTSRMKATVLPTELKEISTNTVSRGSYEPTMVPITLGRRAFPLYIQSEYIWAQILNFHNIFDSACDEIRLKV